MNKKNLRLILSSISLVIFGIILIIISRTTPKIDYIVSNYFANLPNNFLNNFFIFLGNYLKAILIILAIIFIIFLYYKKRKKESFILTISLLSGYILEEIFKSLISRARPSNQLVTEISNSFPSGHSIYSIILFTLIIYFYKDKIRNKLIKSLFIVGNILLILLVGFSRIYINVHWFTDVLGGYALGFFIINLVLLLLTLHPKNKKAKHL